MQMISMELWVPIQERDGKAFVPCVASDSFAGEMIPFSRTKKRALAFQKEYLRRGWPSTKIQKVIVTVAWEG